MSFSFNASRLRNFSSPTKIQPIETPLPSSDPSPSQCTELAKSEHYKVLKFSSALPPLSKNEVIVNSFTDNKTEYAVQITNQRVIVYDYKTMSSQPAQHKITYDFPYSLNEYGIYPQVQLVANEIQRDKPGIVLIDSVSGDLKFIEAIDLAPSLDVLPNEHNLKIKLRRGEFIATREYFDGLGLILTTNFRKVLLISFKDQMGKYFLNSSDISSSTSFIHLFVNPSLLYNIDGYNSSNKISSVKCIDEGPLSKKIIIQEEDGKLSLVQYIKSNGLNLFYQCNLMSYLVSSEEVDLKIRDIEPLENDRYLVLASQSENIFVFTIKLFGTEHKDPVVESKYLISKVSRSLDLKLNILLDGSVAMISSAKFLVFFDVNAEGDSKWEDSIDFRSPHDVFSINVIDDKSATISTRSSILLLELVSCGHKASPSEFVKQHINQYIKYNSNSSPIGFSVEQSNMQILQSDVEEAVTSIIKGIMDSSSSEFKHISSLSHNLSLRVEYMKSLSKFVSLNLEISADLKMDIVVSLEKIMLASELCTTTDLKDVLSGYEIPLNELFTSLVEREILNILMITAQETTNVGNSGEMLKRSKIINKIITKSYVNVEQDVRYNSLNICYSYETKTTPLFFSSIDSLLAINNVVKEISKAYSSVLDSDTDIDLKAEVKEILFNLSLFLYYATSDTLSFLKLQDSNPLFINSSSKFLQLFNDNRETWTKIFILTDNQEKMLELSDKFKDLKSLSEVLESEREIIGRFDSDDPGDQTLIETHTNEVNAKFDFYFTKYGYDFAETLFSYYVASHKVNIFLNNFRKHSAYVTRFLDSKQENWKFGWIYDIDCLKYLKASKSLSKFATSSNQETIDNKKLQLNIAKLSLISAPFSPNNVSVLKEIELNISVIQLQHNFYNLIKDKYQNIKFDEYSTEYLKRYSLLSLQDELSRNFSIFWNNKGVSLLNLINLLTLMKLDNSDITDNFHNLFMLISLLKQKTQSYDSPIFSGLVNSTKELDILEKLIRKRFLLLTNLESLDSGDSIFLSVVEKLANSDKVMFSIPKSKEEVFLSKSDLKVLNVLSDGLQCDYMKENDLVQTIYEKSRFEELLKRVY